MAGDQECGPVSERSLRFALNGGLTCSIRLELAAPKCRIRPSHGDTKLVLGSIGRASSLRGRVKNSPKLRYSLR